MADIVLLIVGILALWTALSYARRSGRANEVTGDATLALALAVAAALAFYLAGGN